MTITKVVAKTVSDFTPQPTQFR